MIWLNDFEYEILMFPEAHHNDEVDSTVQYLQWIRESTARVQLYAHCDLRLIFTRKGIIPARDAGIQEFYQVGEHKNSRFTLKYNI